MFASRFNAIFYCVLIAAHHQLSQANQSEVPPPSTPLLSKGFTSSRSFSSSQSWSSGRDGKSHSNVATTSAETFNDGSQVHTSTATLNCADGDCKRQTKLSRAPASTAMLKVKKQSPSSLEPFQNMDRLFEPMADPISSLAPLASRPWSDFSAMEHMMDEPKFPKSSDMLGDIFGDEHDFFGDGERSQKDAQTQQHAGKSRSSPLLSGHSQSYSSSYSYSNVNGKEESRQQEERCSDGNCRSLLRRSHKSPKPHKA